MQPIVVIPAYEPTDGLDAIISELQAGRPTLQIIVVDDGSSAGHTGRFERLADQGVICLRHAVNMGKGQALKTAMNYVLTASLPPFSGIVTADADGQHLAKDIFGVCDALSLSPSKLWIGARAFDDNVPFRSQLGNTVTRHVFKLLVGSAIRDTQSGLRGIPKSFLPKLLKVSSTGYEFELDMLVLAASQGLSIEEHPIATVYIDGNASSHFRPLLDSLRIYFVFIRFCALSLVTASLDFVVFTAALMTGMSILSCFLTARFVAGSFNFIMSKRLIFKSKATILPEALKFACLVLSLMCISYLLVQALVLYLGVNILLSKFIAEIGLFLLSFAAQRLLVFNRSNHPIEAI